MSRSRSTFTTFREYYYDASCGDEYYMITDLIGSYQDAMEQRGALFGKFEKALKGFPDYSKVNSTSMAELNKYIEKVEAIWKGYALNDAQRGLNSIRDASKVAIECIDSRYGSFEGRSRDTWVNAKDKANAYMDSLACVHASWNEAKQKREVVKAQQQASIEKRQGLIDGSFFVKAQGDNSARVANDQADHSGLRL